LPAASLSSTMTSRRLKVPNGFNDFYSFCSWREALMLRDRKIVKNVGPGNYACGALPFRMLLFVLYCERMTENSR
jgi:hypothetical protein